MMSYNQLRDLFLIINGPYIYLINYTNLLFQITNRLKNNMEVLMMTRVAIPNDTIGTKQYQHNR